MGDHGFPLAVCQVDPQEAEIDFDDMCRAGAIVSCAQIVPPGFAVIV